MTKLKKVIMGVVFVILLCGAFMAGGFVGFSNGYGFRVFQASVGDSFSTFRALEMINAGDIPGAKKHLEMELDTQIIKHWSGLINKPLNFTMLSPNQEAINNLMGRVVAYRTTRPIQADDVKVKEAIETVISRYKK